VPRPVNRKKMAVSQRFLPSPDALQIAQAGGR